MSDKDRKYLVALTNESQYPAAGCAMGPGIYMYHLQASSGAASNDDISVGNDDDDEVVSVVGYSVEEGATGTAD